MMVHKIMEKVTCKMIISDMKEKMDPTQFGNRKGVSIQHYLVKMLYYVISALDNNSRGEAVAVIATMYDWRQAFPDSHFNVMSATKRLKGSSRKHKGSYMSQSNNNTDCHDATVLEVINLLNIGLSTYRFKDTIPSHIPAQNQFIDIRNLKSKEYLVKINEWTEKNLMELNAKKTDEVNGFQFQ